MIDLTPFAQLCESWGGKLVYHTQFLFKRLFRRPEHDRISEAFTEAPAAPWHGINYQAKTVYVVPEHATINGVIHEMGHVFACCDDPDKSDESDFLAWEVAVAFKLKCYREWSLGNSTHGTGMITGCTYDDGKYIGDEWGQINARCKAEFIRMCINYGLKVGNLEWRWEHPKMSGLLDMAADISMLSITRRLEPVAIR